MALLSDIIVKENSVKLMAQPPTVEALLFRRDFTSLAYQNGKLTLCKSANVMSDCARKSLAILWSKLTQF